MRALLLPALCLAGLPAVAPAATYDVSTAAALARLVSSSAGGLRAGDTIRLAAGTYSGAFVVAVSGRKGRPITLQGPSTAVLTNPSGYGLQIKASYWKLTGFTVQKSLKGVVLDGANHNLIDHLTVRSIDQEGIHLRTFSSDNVVQYSRISHTGLGINQSPYGEGIYIGSALSNWPVYTGGLSDKADRNCIAHNTLGPSISAEGIDVKEGTSGGWLIANSYDRPSLTQYTMDFNGADSFLDVKGDGYIVYGNIVDNSGVDAYLRAGIQAHQNIVAGIAYGNGNLFHMNTMSLMGTARYGFDLDTRTWGNQVCTDNTATGDTAGLSNTGTSSCSVLSPPPACPDVLNR